MTKTLVTILISVIILFACSYGEYAQVKRTFDTFYTYLVQTEIKLKNKTATTEDAVALKDFWLNKKKGLHIWIPHSDIKEVDLWLGETVAFTENGKFDEAITKIVVLKVLSKQIPETYILRAENIL